MGMSVPERRVIVVGGGAAGMMASIFAVKAGARVTLLERGEKLGKKVYITGKGRCNVTNDCTLDEFLHEVARNPRFLYSALSFFSPQDMIHLLEDAGGGAARSARFSGDGEGERRDADAGAADAAKRR